MADRGCPRSEQWRGIHHPDSRHRWTFKRDVDGLEGDPAQRSAPDTDRRDALARDRAPLVEVRSPQEGVPLESPAIVMDQVKDDLAWCRDDFADLPVSHTALLFSRMAGSEKPPNVRLDRAARWQFAYRFRPYPFALSALLFCHALATLVLYLGRILQDSFRDSLDDWTLFTAAIFEQHYPCAFDYADI